MQAWLAVQAGRQAARSLTGVDLALVCTSQLGWAPRWQACTRRQGHLGSPDTGSHAWPTHGRAVQLAAPPRPPERAPADQATDYELLQRLQQEGGLQTGVIMETNKGGLIVQLDVGGRVRSAPLRCSGCAW